MNAALFVMAWVAGADSLPIAPVAPAPLPTAPAIVSTGSSCSGGCGTIAAPCESTCDSCGTTYAAPTQKKSLGLFSRFKGGLSFGKTHHAAPTDCGCEPAPCTTCAPAPVAVPCTTCAPAPVVMHECATCDTCETPAQGHTKSKGLFSRFKGFSFGKKHTPTPECGCEVAPACDSCTSGSVITPSYPTAPTYPAPSYPAPGVMPAPVAPMITPAPMAPMTPMIPEAVPAPKELPKDKIGGLIIPNITPVVAPRELTGANSPFDLPRQDATGFGHSADYSTLKGTLTFVHADGGYWSVRYASLSEEDRFGGRVMLARDTDMESYREGDLVQVSGNIIKDKTSSTLTAPLYRIDTITLKTRGN